MGSKKATQKSAKSSTASTQEFKGFTNEERAAMKERAQELKADARRRSRRGKAELTATEEARIRELVKQAVS